MQQQSIESLQVQIVSYAQQNLQIYQFQPFQLTQKDEKARSQIFEASKKRQALLRNFVTQSLEIDKNLYTHQKTQVITLILAELTQKVDQLEDQIAKSQKMIETTEICCLEAEQHLQILQSYQSKESIEEMNVQINEIKLRIKETNNQRLDIAKTINTQELVKALINLKNKDFENPLIQLWRWILVFLYKEQPSNYFWSNFRDEVFIKDKGKDFQERCGKVKGVNLKIDEAQRTYDILKERELILSSQLLSEKQKEAIKRIFQIIQLIATSQMKSEEIVEKEKIIAKILKDSEEASLLKDKVAQRIIVYKEQKVLFSGLKEHYLEMCQKVQFWFIFWKLVTKSAGYKQAKALNMQHIKTLQDKYEVLKNCSYDQYIEKIEQMRMEIQNEFQMYQQHGPGSQTFQQSLYQPSLGGHIVVITEEQQNEQKIQMKQSTRNIHLKQALPENPPEIQVQAIKGTCSCEICGIF